MSKRKPKVEVWKDDELEHFIWDFYYGDGAMLYSPGVFDTHEEAIADFEKLINAVAEIARDQGRYDG